MEKENITKICEDLQKDLRLNNWNIDLTFKELKGFGRVETIKSEENIAIINLSPSSHRNHNQIMTTLLHEFYHILIKKLEKQIKLTKNLSETESDGSNKLYNMKIRNLKDIDKTWDDLGKIIEAFGDLNEMGEIQFKKK